MAGVRVPVGHPPVVFCTPGNRDLCEKIVDHLSWTIGRVRFRTFANGEISVKLEQSVANNDVFVICSRDDLEGEINFMLMQLLILLDALKSEAPHRITVVLPCVEYARQDRKFEAGEAIAPKLLLHLMVTAGADRFVTIDLHNQAESGFSPAHAALDELTCEKYLANFIRESVPDFTPEETLVCATDAGGAKRTRKMADELQVGFMMADKFRPRAGEVGQVKIISDASINPKNVIIIDDMFDTCGSLVKVVEAVHNYMPQAKIYAVGTHGYFSKDAADRIAKMIEDKTLEWIAVTNCISQRAPLKKFEAVGIANSLKVVDISRLLSGAIIRIHLGASVNLPKFRQLGPLNPDPLLAEAAFVPTSQYTLKAAAAAPTPSA
mmetsp:Transcript_51231/g.130144  ORF Transcript_51231/g.130144 Transcript_51231/m.130144 type:complete len:379 (-) Transcript_51231:39-1175(-)|eukprot:CAMPEP_0183396214 /NCGR_PEP_ID=MMETSP0370-20130417/9873_1 /TAXON_ID=268820 /ORGANISM="Peridinium aciculiferum, Strain PAER-2" /LENGTH=378 /DNA_ID=CAMNT_0025576977 /DNA_START=43 /DNA_END=1179 /DNA_ORIENTATION=-